MAHDNKVRTSIVAAALVVIVGAGGAYGISQVVDDGPAQAATTSPGPGGTTAPAPAETDAAAPAPARAAQTPSSTPTKTPTSTKTPEPTPDAILTAGDSGGNVRELQARLKQIQWYVPDITGEYDDVTVEAVTGFQAKRGLEETGEVDEETWDRLVAMTREPTDDEMHNRIVAGPPILQEGDTGDDVRELQARLKQIDWFDHEVTPNYGAVTAQAVAGFQVKRGLPETGAVDQETWDRLAAMTREPTDDEMHNRTPEDDSNDSDGVPLDPRCTTGRALCIDKNSNSLRWVIDGQVQMTLDVRFGTELTPTREGAFQVGWKSRNHVSSLYGSSMPYAMFFSGGQAVHYSADFAANGYNGGSHGCVNVRDEGAIASLFNQVNVGDKVIVYRS